MKEDKGTVILSKREEFANKRKAFAHDKGKIPLSQTIESRYG